jgi:hypothetical protein
VTTGSSLPGLPSIPGILPSILGVQRLFLDTGPVIYFVEANPAFFSSCEQVFDAIDQGDAIGLTSVLTLTEVLVHPLRSGDTAL